jgi:hypothetical protein
MPLPLTGTVGAPSNVSLADGVSVPLLQGKGGELVATELHGKYYTQAYRGNAYYASVAATGVVTTAFSNGTYVGGLLWNPQGSGKNLIPIRAAQGRILAATTVCAFGHAYLANAGAGVATAAPVSAFTAVAAALRGPLNQPGVTGQGNSVALVGAGATFTTALTWGRANGFAAGTETTAIVEQAFVEDFDGMLIIPPGTVFAFFAATAAQGGTWVPSIIWEEAPL